MKISVKTSNHSYDVIIENDVTIGAGAVITRNIPSNVTVAGVPAKIIGESHPEYINNRY